MKKKTFLFSILDHKEGDSFIIVSKDKYGGVAPSSYILINSRPASELSLLPHTNVTSLQWRWWFKYDLLFFTRFFFKFLPLYSFLFQSSWLLLTFPCYSPFVCGFTFSLDWLWLFILPLRHALAAPSVNPAKIIMWQTHLSLQKRYFATRLDWSWTTPRCWHIVILFQFDQSYFW